MQLSKLAHLVLKNKLNLSLYFTNIDTRKNRNGKPWNLLKTCCGLPYTSFFDSDPGDIYEDEAVLNNPHWEWESGFWKTHILINGELEPLYSKDTPAREDFFSEEE